ncbi:MAG: tripartite tricarboxylate transporter TctB family protein, partial [Pseudomonadota bacterium]
DAIGDLPGQFFGRPLSMVIIAMTLISFLYPFMPQIKRLVRNSGGSDIAVKPRASAAAVGRDLISFALFAMVGLVVIVQSANLNAEAAVFPRTIAIGMLVVIAIAVVRLLFTRHVTEEAVEGSNLRRIAVPAIMLAAVALLGTLGFALTGLIMALALIWPAQHGSASHRYWVILVTSVGVLALAFTYGFDELLSVPLPAGTLF